MALSHQYAAYRSILLGCACTEYKPVGPKYDAEYYAERGRKRESESERKHGQDCYRSNCLSAGNIGHELWATEERAMVHLRCLRYMVLSN